MDEQDREDATDTIPAATRPWVRKLEVGEILFREGDRDQRVFVLLDGRVEILKNGQRIAEVGVSESFIGEVSALTGKERWATARTVKPSTFLVVERIESLFRADVSWAVKVASTLAQRLDRTNERLVRLKSLLEETRSRELNQTLVDTLDVALAETKQGL